MALEVGGWSGKIPNKSDPRERIGVCNVSRGQEDKGQRAHAEGGLYKSTEERKGWCVLGIGGQRGRKRSWKSRWGQPQCHTMNLGLGPVLQQGNSHSRG